MAHRPDAQHTASPDTVQGGVREPLQSSSGQPSPDTQPQKRDWTGFATKTLWDWMQLLIIPVVLAAVSLSFNAQQASTSLTVGQQQQEEAALTTYINDISDLLMTQHLRSSRPGDEVRVVARGKTFATMKRLDGERKGEILQFLYETHLIGYVSVGANGRTVVQKEGIVDLYGIDASQADLTRAYLEGAHLEGLKLQGAKLQGADVAQANLRYAKIEPEQLAHAYSLQNTLLPDGSQFPSRSWPIPDRDVDCIQLDGSSCRGLQEIEQSPTPVSPPPYP